VTDHLAALRRAMNDAGIDAVLVAAPAAAATIIGNRRVAVHGPSGPLPTAIVPRDDRRLPVALTPDPDGAPDRAAVILHGIAWNPATLLAAVRDTLGPAAGTVAIDVASPGALALLRDALPEARWVDGTAVITQALLAKGERERAALARACVVAHRAADAAARAAGASGRTHTANGAIGAAVASLDGAFPIADLVAGRDRVVVEIVVDGFAGVARLGPGDAEALNDAVAMLGGGVGESFGALASRLPAGVEVGGLGRGHELPRLRGPSPSGDGGWACPAEVRLTEGAVLLVTSGAAAVTVAVTAGGPALLSPPPAEVVR
jgi:hypothetical protein